VPATFWTLTTTYPGMLLALAGTLCLVMVVGTSIRAARTRLRYESWHLLHLYAYLGVGLALPHQLCAAALPILKQETLSAQSADSDMVSGATVTSEGYVESLQSALDQAGS
jgi:DMSO/TMAO reductase YedYZ heme-binding membrane subunit